MALYQAPAFGQGAAKEETTERPPSGVNGGFKPSHFRGFARATLEHHRQFFSPQIPSHIVKGEATWKLQSGCH